MLLASPPLAASSVSQYLGRAKERGGRGTGVGVRCRQVGARPRAQCGRPARAHQRCTALLTTLASGPACCARGAARQARAETAPLGLATRARPARALGGSALEGGARCAVSGCDASCGSSAKPRQRALVVSTWSWQPSQHAQTLHTVQRYTVP